MKFKVLMKDTDVLDDACRDAAAANVAAMGLASQLSANEIDMLVEGRYNTIREFAGQWIRYGEEATLEFDTEAGTATVAKDS